MGVFKFPDLVIAVGADVSNIIGGNLFDYLDSLTIYAPGTLAGVVTVEVADTEPGVAVAGDFRQLQKDESDVNITVDDATSIQPINFRSLRLKSTVVAGAGGETYKVTGDDQVAAQI